MKARDAVKKKMKSISSVGKVMASVIIFVFFEMQKVDDVCCFVLYRYSPKMLQTLLYRRFFSTDDPLTSTTHYIHYI